MKTFWMVLLVVSGSWLGYLLWRSRMTKGWFVRFGAHLIMAAMAIYLLNFSGMLGSGWYVPLNPVTIGTVAVLGVPGIALVLGLQWSLLA